MSETERTMDQAKLRAWIGKTEEASDTIHVGPARLMQATLDREPKLKTGDELPLGWHRFYFPTEARSSALGRDGHSAMGEFLPPVALPRRMWAGGRFDVTSPVLFGETVKRISTIKNVVMKEGRTGPLCFVTVVHDHRGADGAGRFTEEQSLVFREDPEPGQPAQQPTAPPANAVVTETITPSPVQLFRYSALTFNSHRIHYDVDYCRDVEGYPGLIFHGPFTATLLADLAARHGNGKRISSFDYRAISPLYDTGPFSIHWNGTDTVWAETPDGALAMKAKVEFA
ncbi:MaoC family dehydratase N-terminal domain-containing protein [Ahrensia sp. R2A130]|uniref:FAS1-like dehydratase domain-containing protein n=1 Tax=Ahrensia sp. R2A130 TaxID=744979 RepID=UPI0001E0BC30|nr:MaoC family dehydratase N-terminal domain-containing protein [Ahrensia sp. R2A130]EFL90738.1 itaconyl-CoA hydratase [Ahrensia sp. R2A130]